MFIAAGLTNKTVRNFHTNHNHLSHQETIASVNCLSLEENMHRIKIDLDDFCATIDDKIQVKIV